MNIAFVINEPVQDVTGGYKMVYMYANSLISNGHDVSIYYRCKKERLFLNYRAPFFVKMLVATVLSRKGPKWFSLDSKVKGYAITKINDSTIKDNDIVIATAVDTANDVYKLSKEKGKKCYFIQDFENWEYSDEYVYNTYSLGMKNIVVAKWLKEIVDKHTKRESIVVSNGIDSNIFFNENKSRKKHSIVFQYRDMKYKGGTYAIECVKRLKEIYPELEVNVISTDNRPKSLPEFCKYHQSITPEQVAKINNESEVFICTSLEEGYGLPGLEAMACGCAIASFSYRGVFEYAEDGNNALLSPVKDVDSLVNNVCKLFGDKSLRKKIIENGIKTAEALSSSKMGKLFCESITND